MQNSKLKTQKLVEKYGPSLIEKKWQEVWEKEKIYSPNLDASTSLSTKKPFYNLMMFPYPSAEGMHVGNMYAFTGADVYGRFQRMQGKDVFEPIGLDGFGIHSENYAIKVGTHPAEQAKISETNFYRQLRSIGNSFDWTRTVETYKPEYYKWTQWLFVQMFKAGLAYRKKAPVNFCPSCKTVLSDEQVIDGLCERCNSVVEKRDLEQWFFRITKYADRLLSNLSQIDWSERVKIAQREWIGRSEGMIINFGGIDVFTTRPETADGATFLVLSPQHPFVASLKGKEIKDYVENAKRKTGSPDEVLTKSGVFTGEYVVNPLNKKKIPVWIAGYVLMGYGTGAIMAVPAEDERDREFAEKYEIPIIKTSLSAQPIGKKVVNYHLRDWLISRQRYWGPPIPMIFCQSCAGEGKSWFSEHSENSANQKIRLSDNQKFRQSEFSEFSEMAGWYPEENLPVLLPFIKDYKPLGTGVAPLASHPEFYETKCPKCGGEAKRETDVSDTFLDSAWYFLRYVSTDIETAAFDREKVKKWLPVNMYIGGAEHSVLHLLYSRFITMAIHDMGHFSFEEPFTKFRAHGLIVKDGAKMSKSKGNVVVPDVYIKKFGADALRTYLMFMGPYSQGGDFRDSGIEGMFRFLSRVWRLVSEAMISADKNQNQRISADDQRESSMVMHKTIKKVTEDIENLSYNTAIAALMEWYNEISKLKDQISKIEIETFLKLLAPFAPHMTEELFFRISTDKNQNRRISADNQWKSIHKQQWPKYDEKYLVANEVIIAVQINGKLRDTLKVQSSKFKVQSYIEQLARESDKIKKYLEEKKILKVIYIEGKVVNFVTSV